MLSSRSRHHPKKWRLKLNRVTYRIDEVATMLGLGRTTVYKLIEDGHLTRIKVGARTLIRATDVEALLQRQAA